MFLPNNSFVFALSFSFLTNSSGDKFESSFLNVEVNSPDDNKLSK